MENRYIYHCNCENLYHENDQDRLIAQPYHKVVGATKHHCRGLAVCCIYSL